MRILRATATRGTDIFMLSLIGYDLAFERTGIVTSRNTSAEFLAFLSRTIIARIVHLSRVARIRVTSREFGNTELFGFVEVHPRELRVERPDQVLEPRRKPALVLPGVVDDCAVAVHAKVVHLPRPCATEPLVNAKWHLRIDLAGVRCQEFHGGFVPLETDAVLRPLEVHVGRRTDTRRATCAGRGLVRVRKNQLVPVPIPAGTVGVRTEILHVIEPKSHVIHTRQVVPDHAAEPVLPVLVSLCDAWRSRG